MLMCRQEGYSYFIEAICHRLKHCIGAAVSHLPHIHVLLSVVPVSNFLLDYSLL